MAAHKNKIQTNKTKQEVATGARQITHVSKAMKTGKFTPYVAGLLLLSPLVHCLGIPAYGRLVCIFFFREARSMNFYVKSHYFGN